MSSPAPLGAPTPPAPAHGPGENLPLNAVRSLAALAVVMSHARDAFFADYDDVPHTFVETALYGITALGHQAVVVFFVLSGYWVGGSALRQLRRRRFTWRGYIVDRVTRLWIVLLPALVLTLVLDLIGRSMYGDLTTYTGDPRYNGTIIAGKLSAGIFAGNAFFLGSIRTPVLGSNAALWSLGYEFWMYLIGPLVVFAILLRRRVSLLQLAIAAVIAALVGVDVLLYVPVWLLGMGIAASELRIIAVLKRLGTTRVRVIRVVALVVTLVVATVVRGVNTLPDVAADYLVAVPTAVLLASLVQGSIGERRPNPLLRGTSFLAASSYSLYAVHVPILVLAASVAGLQVESRWDASPLHWLALIGIIAACVVIGWLFASVTERHTSRVRGVVRRLVLRGG